MKIERERRMDGQILPLLELLTEPKTGRKGDNPYLFPVSLLAVVVEFVTPELLAVMRHLLQILVLKRS